MSEYDGHMRPGTSVMLCAALAAAGCGGGSGGGDWEPLTCDLVTADDNCYTVAVESLYACMDAASVANDDWLVAGDVDATGETCADADSPRRATFDPPLPTDTLTDRWPWELGAVTLWNGTTECGTVTFDERADGSRVIDVTIGGDSAAAIRRSDTLEDDDVGYYAYECPDGSSYRSPNEDLVSCWTRYPSLSSAVNFGTNGQLALDPPGAPLTLRCDLPAP